MNDTYKIYITRKKKIISNIKFEISDKLQKSLSQVKYIKYILNVLHID